MKIYLLQRIKPKQASQQTQIKILAIAILIFRKNSKRLVRATLKTYDQTGTYVFLKVFKKATEGAEFECVQRLSLSSEEFSKLLKSGKSIRAQTKEISDTVENKDKPQSNCKRARKTQLSSNTNEFKHDSN